MLSEAATRMRTGLCSQLVPHLGERGGGGEVVLRRFLSDPLPKRFTVDTGFVFDHSGDCSDVPSPSARRRRNEPIRRCWQWQLSAAAGCAHRGFIRFRTAPGLPSRLSSRASRASRASRSPCLRAARRFSSGALSGTRDGCGRGGGGHRFHAPDAPATASIGVATTWQRSRQKWSTSSGPRPGRA